jgi:hypothetical protein
MGANVQISIVTIGINASVKLKNIELMNCPFKLVSKYFTLPTIGSIVIKMSTHEYWPIKNNAIESIMAIMIVRVEGFICLLLTNRALCRLGIRIPSARTTAD